MNPLIFIGGAVGLGWLISKITGGKKTYSFAWIAGQQLLINKTDNNPIFYAGLQLTGNVGNLQIGDVVSISSTASDLNGKEVQIIQFGNDDGTATDQIAVIDFILEQPRKESTKGTGEITVLRNEPVKNVNIIPSSEWEIMADVPTGENIPFILNDSGKKIRPLDRFPITKGESFFIDKFYSSVLWDEIFDGKGDFLDSVADKEKAQKLLVVSIAVGLISRKNITDACAFAMDVVAPALLLASFDLKKPPAEKKKRIFKVIKGLVKGICSAAALAVNIIPGVGQVASAAIIVGTVALSKAMDKLPGDVAPNPVDDVIASGRKIYTDVVKNFINPNQVA